MKNGTILLLIVGFVVFSGCDNKAEYGEGLSSVSWLPDSATDISYYKSYLYTAYELDMSEEQFLQWAKDKSWEISEIVEPISIGRYNRYLLSDSKNDPGYWAKVFAEIESGYFYRWERGKSGGGVNVAYDSIKKRVYYQYNPR